MPQQLQVREQMLGANKDTPRQHKQRMERQIVVASISVQAILSIVVVGFCVQQLSRCPINSRDVDNGGQCPRALYTNIITATVAMWFPSPYYAMISGIYGLPDSGSSSRNTRKRVTVEEGVQEEDGLK